ncbi:MAG: acyl carrier protein [Planctomycetaceae bacterium]|jgi:acyl carrier protein|nr:acyl carrier protein [Planctomycetaceae bacterium]MDP7277073.1 acyl carrier protein [Planctomycetaceae bacterium]
MPTHEEILGQVQGILVEALGADEDEVTPGATLVSDLGAESIDFLDIVFNLEKEFDIKIPRGELFPENLAAEGDGLAVDGVVTEEGLTKLREKLPFADIEAFAADPQVANIQDLFTVDMLVNFVSDKLGNGE